MRTISLVKMCASNVDNSSCNKPPLYTNLLPATTTRKIHLICVYLLINTLDVRFLKRHICISICNTQKDTSLLTHHLQSQRKCFAYLLCSSVIVINIHKKKKNIKELSCTLEIKYLKIFWKMLRGADTNLVRFGEEA